MGMACSRLRSKQNAKHIRQRPVSYFPQHVCPATNGHEDARISIVTVCNSYESELSRLTKPDLDALRFFPSVPMHIYWWYIEWRAGCSDMQKGYRVKPLAIKLKSDSIEKSLYTQDPRRRSGASAGATNHPDGLRS